MAKKELTDEGAKALIHIISTGYAPGVHREVRRALQRDGFLRREGEGIRTTYQVTAKGFRTLEREHPGAMEAMGRKKPDAATNRQAVLLTEVQARDIFEAAEVCLNEVIGPDMVDTLQALAAAFPAIRDDRGCMSTLEWMGGKAPGGPKR